MNISTCIVKLISYLGYLEEALNFICMYYTYTILVDKDYKSFNNMIYSYCFNFVINHFTCIVDLLRYVG